MPKLTEAFVGSLGPGRERTIFDFSLPGFAIRVTPAGSKIFIARAKVAGRKSKITIGYHPELTVAQARLALADGADTTAGELHHRHRPSSTAKANASGFSVNRKSARPPMLSSRPSGQGRSARMVLPGCALRCSPEHDQAKSPPSNGITLTGIGASFACPIARRTSHARSTCPMPRSKS